MPFWFLLNVIHNNWMFRKCNKSLVVVVSSFTEDIFFMIVFRRYIVAFVRDRLIDDDEDDDYDYDIIIREPQKSFSSSIIYWQYWILPNKHGHLTLKWSVSSYPHDGLARTISKWCIAKQ